MMERSGHSDQILELGQNLVKELKLGPDTLERWMAHHIAELMDRASSSSGEEKEAINKECCATILDLWKNQSEFGRIRRKLLAAEEIVATIAELRADSPWYNTYNRDNNNKSYCKQALSIDRASRELISLLLLLANEQSQKTEKIWLDLARVLPSVARTPSINILLIASDALKEISETEIREKIISEAREGISQFRLLIDDIEKAVNVAAGQSVRPSAKRPRRPK